MEVSSSATTGHEYYSRCFPSEVALGLLTYDHTAITVSVYSAPTLLVQEGKKMNLLRLPHELLVCILLSLDPSDLLACGLVCRGLNGILGTPALKHKILLAKTGMRQATTGKLSLLDGIKALEEYQIAWRSLPPTTDSSPHTAQHDSLRYPRFAGDALALLSGATLRLFRPSCSIRRVQPQTWSIDLSVAQLEIHYCAVDSSQGLVAISGVDLSSPESMQCHLISLSGTSLRSYHPQAAVHAFTTPTYAAYAYSRKIAVYGDLVGWMWRDRLDRLRVYNWKTGALIWQCHSTSYTVCFAFLDETRLLVACEKALRIYVIDPHARVDPWHPTPTDYSPPICMLELPPLSSTDASSDTMMLESQRPVANGDVAFEREASLTVLAMLFLAHTASSIERYLFVIPVATLLGCLSSNLDKNTPHAVPPYSPLSIPWDSWGASCGCLFPILKVYDYMPVGLSVMGSTCAIMATSGDLATLDAFVFDFHALAHPESTANDDREILAHFMDGSRVVRSAKLLRDPIRNTLPYRVVHKTIAYNDDPDFAAAVTSHSFTLLEDGLAVVVCVSIGDEYMCSMTLLYQSTTMEKDMWRLRLFAVDKPIQNKSI
ncbi:hypothetical protein GY45DRAFT_946084 [Cubamyces sp. BRFM 1775]|nr:hypothetical protein GY45DRAFT_946084 [Cubamyces sp. BRFM 1775]